MPSIGLDFIEEETSRAVRHSLGGWRWKSRHWRGQLLPDYPLNWLRPSSVIEQSWPNKTEQRKASKWDLIVVSKLDHVRAYTEYSYAASRLWRILFDLYEPCLY